MNIFIDRDVKRLFLTLLYIFAAFIVLSQGYFFLADGSLNRILLLLSLFFAAGIFFAFFLYFWRQKKVLDEAITQMNLFTSGDNSVRIESGSEGSLYKLFHEINTLATTLNAHAVQEQNTKVFLRNTISDISHQLKTPLAALAVYNALLQEESGDKKAVREFAYKSEKELERIDILVQNLLKITKLDAGSIFMDRHIETISDMMHELKAYFEIRAKQEHKEIILWGKENETLCCDRVWLVEAVSNIVKNALDHTAENGQIHIRWSKLPSVTQIIIKDNGSGIHSEDIYHIFKRFYRSRFSKDIQGAGLGLPLAKAIVEAHNGSITVDSIQDNGSTFILNFLNLEKQ